MRWRREGAVVEPSGSLRLIYLGAPLADGVAADLTAGSPTWLSIAGWLRPPHPSARDEPNAHHDEDTGDDEEPAGAAHASNEPERAEEREHPGDLPDVVASDGRVMRAAAGSTEPQHRNRCHPEEEASHGQGWPALGSEPKRIKHRIRAPLRRPTSSRARKRECARFHRGASAALLVEIN